MLKLTAITKSYIWGGEKLKALYGRSAAGVIAESWEASVHPDGRDEAFFNYLNAHPKAVDGAGSAFPVLIKYIDAAKDLSVQVHPDDEYARRHENDNGKTEFWYVIQADEGAGVYCGFNRNVTRDEFLQKIADGTVCELLNYVPVKCGDCLLIKAGTVHAICAGCVVCEIQQSSNVVYRVYDYNRVGAEGRLRPLHIDKAVDVINFSKFVNRTNSGECEDAVGGKIKKLASCKYFSCSKLELDGEYSATDTQSFTVVNAIDGSGQINGIHFNAGDSFFIPCNEQLNLSGNATLLLTSK